MKNGHAPNVAVGQGGDLILIRHAQTRSNGQGSWHGSLDEGLSRLGHEEALEAAERLRERTDLRVSAVLSSDLLRAVETAEILASAIGVRKVVRDRRLRERDMGEWSGRSPAEVEKKWPGMLRRWIEGSIPGPPGGETDAAVAKRARCALLERGDRERGLMLVVTHGGVIRSLRREGGLPNDPVAHLGGYMARIECRPGKVTLGKEILLGDPAAQPAT
jgi:probable phosphoglycerate mutase